MLHVDNIYLKTSEFKSTSDIINIFKTIRNHNMTGFNVLLRMLASLLVVNAVEKKCYSETGRCFWLGSTSSVNRETARSVCQSQEGDLAVMETKVLWDFVSNEFRYDFFGNYLTKLKNHSHIHQGIVNFIPTKIVSSYICL